MSALWPLAGVRNSVRNQCPETCVTEPGFGARSGFMSLPVHPLAGQRVGYARISGASQNLDGQTDALTAAGCQKIFADTASGKLTERPELTLCLGYLRAGDTLVVWRPGRPRPALFPLGGSVNPP